MKKRVLSSAKKKILFLPHAIKQMSRPDRIITTDEIREAVLSGEIIEEYPDDQRGESCLVLYTNQDEQYMLYVHQNTNIWL